MVLIVSGIGRWLWHWLILLFILIVCVRCTTQPADITIIWEDDRATGVSLPREYFGELSDDSIRNKLHFQLLPSTNNPSILGEYYFSNGAVVFKPLIPFTRGLTYEAEIAGREGVRFAIPEVDQLDRPFVEVIYPTQDTLPSNLLKVYLKFSRSMREGQSLHYITVLRNTQDTIPAVFLDLQPELWNYDGTILTLWLDPGRIKRDLQPNRKMGAPLEEASSYRLSISKEWEDTRGASLQRDYLKDFFIIQRDSLSPEPLRWTINTPEAGTRDPMIVNFHESLDYVLLLEAISVRDANGNAVSGEVILENEETVYRFTPDGVWKKGTYFLQSEARLEDHAGNNLNRPFDRDLTGKTMATQQEVFRREFLIN